MPTCLSPVAELLVEAERQRLSRVQVGNEDLHHENVQLIEQIQDLRQHIQMRRDVLERRRRFRLSLQGGVYRVYADLPASDP